MEISIEIAENDSGDAIGMSDGLESGVPTGTITVRLMETGEIEYPDNTTGIAMDDEANPSRNTAQLHWSALVPVLKVVYETTEALECITCAIKLLEEAVATTENDLNRATILSEMGDFSQKKYMQLGALGDLERSILWATEAAALVPANHPERVVFCGKLADMVYHRYERLGTLDDLEKAIKLGEDAAATSTPDHPDRAHRSNILASYLHGRYERLGALDDLEQAIKKGEEAVTASPSDSPNRASCLGNLANFFRSRYERFGVLSDIELAIKWGKDAVAASLPDHPDRKACLTNLAGYFRCRYERSGAPEDLEQAISWGEDAVEASIPDRPDQKSCLNSFASFFRSRYERSGFLGDLEIATKCEEDAVTANPGKPGRVACLSNLAGYFYTRYERFRALDDLEQAISHGESAVEGIPFDNPDRTVSLNNLAGYLHSRYIRLGALKDIELAITYGESVVAASSLNHPDQALRLNNLATYFYTRCGHTGASDDIQRAIKWGQDALTVTPSDHPQRQSRLGNLSTYFYSRYKLLETLDDLKQAIKLGEDAVAACPSDHISRSRRLNNLASCLESRYLETHSPEDFNYTLRNYCEAWQCKASPPQDRISGAHKAGKLFALTQRWQESSSILEDAVRMLPEVSPRFLERDDQEIALSDFTRLAAEAVSVSLQAGIAASHCLRLLELGRGIIIGLAIDCRSDLSELQIRDPDLFNRFNRLRTEIDSPLDRIRTEFYEATDQNSRRQRLRLIDEIEETLTCIRQISGFEGFQLPPPSEDLMAMALEGPIVIFNCTEYRGDAIIVTTTSIKALELPRLIYEDVNDRMTQLARGLTRGKRSTYPRRNEKLEELLLWLWNVAVEPVLKELQLETIVNDTNLTRIWWIGVGPLAVAPFHAAGDYSPTSTCNNGTLDRVISSYIPTIKALSYSRQKKLQLLSKPDPRLLLVTMPTTPGKSPLKNATREIEEITRIVERNASIPGLDSAGNCAVDERITCIPVRLESPSATDVLGQLPLYNAIHFACHGVSNRDNPSGSHLLLLKDGAIDKLTVGDISNTNTKNGQLAYLSACCTAENLSATLADESIHIASGFQLAGFSHVLATLWESNDVACRQVAGDFYSLLFDRHAYGSDSQGHQKVSISFHYAVKKLRDQCLEEPIKWASFIHTGA